MLPPEIKKQIRRIEFSTRRLMTETLSGQYQSRFKGQGVQFSEHRAYVPGDDVRHINWNVSARTREPLVKIFDEERELQVFLLVDVSGSLETGSKKQLKRQTLFELTALLAYAACFSGDKVGLMLFSDQVEKMSIPMKGQNKVFQILSELLLCESLAKKTNISLALRSAQRLLKHRGVVIVLSDWMQGEGEDYAPALKRLNQTHDVLAIWLRDSVEKESPPPLGVLSLLDPETGQERLVNTRSQAFRTWIKKKQEAFDQLTRERFRGSQIEFLEVSTQEDYANKVVQFLRYRRRS